MSRQTPNTATAALEADVNVQVADELMGSLGGVAAAAAATLGGRRVCHNRRHTDVALVPLEARRLMAADAGTVSLVGDTLTLSALDVDAPRVAVELDRDGSHLRGIVVGDNGERTEGEWVAVGSVGRIAVEGADGVDNVRLDARLNHTRPEVNLGNGVQQVEVFFAKDGQSAHRGVIDAFRFARSIGRNHAGVAVNTTPGRISDVDVTVGGADVQINGLRVEREGQEPIHFGDGARLARSEVFGGGIVVDVADASGDAFGGSVGFKLVGPDGVWERVENATPFAVHSDHAGDLYEWAAKPGSYRLEMTAFTGKNGTGESGTTSVRFVVTADAEAIPDDVVEAAPLPTATQPVASRDADAPDVDINVLHKTIVAGQSVHVDGLGTTFTHGEFNDATFAWNFGDNGSKFNAYRGFVAGHVYDRPGVYTVTLTVTDEAGKVGVATAKITVTASQRRLIHVDAKSGNDRNDGRTTGSAVRSVARAVELLEAHGDHTEIKFRRGQTHGVSEGITLRHDDVYLSSYGTGSKPLLEWRGEHSWAKTMVRVDAEARGATIRGLAFTNRGVGHTDKKIANAIIPGGEATAIVDNTFYKVSCAVLGSHNPDGVLVQGNTAPTVDGIRAYFVWGEGEGWSILGNTVANSTREHIIRVSAGVSGVTISGNDLTNLDRRGDGDRYDTAKGVLTVQAGEFAYVSDNAIHGPTGVGPLGDGDGLPYKDSRWEYAVFERNSFDGQFNVEHGAEHVDFRYNRLHLDDNVALIVEGHDADYGRTVVDLTVHGNVATNNGDRGGFMRSWAGARHVAVTGNAYVAPNLNVGHYGSAAMSHAANDLSSFSVIDANTWPMPTEGGWAEGGMNWLGDGLGQEGFRDAVEWNALGRVGTDTFADVDADRVYELVLRNAV